MSDVRDRGARHGERGDSQWSEGPTISSRERISDLDSEGDSEGDAEEDADGDPGRTRSAQVVRHEPKARGRRGSAARDADAQRSADASDDARSGSAARPSGSSATLMGARAQTPEPAPEQADLYREMLESAPVATALLDRAGLITGCNKAFADLIQVPASAVAGEPLLGWLARASGREGFGRAFIGLRDKEPGRGFVLDLAIRPHLGPVVDCVVRSTRLSTGHVSVTCQRASTKAVSPEAELGLAVTRSLDALDQGVLLVDPDGKVVHQNPAAVKLLGDGLAGRSFLELADPASVHNLTRALHVARSGSWQGEVDLRRLDGEPLPVELSLAAGTGPAVVLLRDLRERRRRAFEARLAGQVDRCLVAAADPRSSVMDACAALASGLGAARVSMVVRHRGAWERWALHGEAPQRAVPLSGREPPPQWATGEHVETTEELDGDVISVFGPPAPGTRPREDAVRVLLRAPAGLVGHLLLTPGAQEWDARDQTLIAGLAAQIALGLANGLLTLETRELAAYQAMVLDQGSVLIDSLDAEGRVVTWNRAGEEVLGVPAAQAVGQRFGIEVAPAVEAEQWEALWTELSEKGTVARQITLLAADQREVPMHVEGRLLRDAVDESPDALGGMPAAGRAAATSPDGAEGGSEGGTVRGAVLVGLDLTERRGLERQILKSQKLAAVGLLAAGIAHEINNPLSGVVGYSKLLLEKPLPDPIRERVQKIADSGERCRKIVEGVLLFSRQQDGGVRRKVDLRTLVDRVIAIGEYQWRMHNVRVIREADESVEIMADADQLEQVLLNLLSNAVDAMPHGGAIRVSLRRLADASACLSVADEGHGIPEEIQARIFDPFFSTKEIGKGTGLGLAISYGIVQDHGGDIVVQSTHGRGAEFVVTLPAQGDPPTPSEASA